MLAAVGLHAAGYRCASEFLLRRDERTGCVLLDIGMPDVSGIDLMRALNACVPVHPIIFLTARDDVMTSVEAMKQGAFDCEEQRSAEMHLSELRLRFASLTEVESAVLFGIASSKLNKQIAADLGLCERTVKAKRAQMMEKLRLRTVPDVIKAAKLLEDANACARASWTHRSRVHN
jgi:two-component system, LuxR family, response regulator FixJ